MKLYLETLEYLILIKRSVHLTTSGPQTVRLYHQKVATASEQKQRGTCRKGKQNLSQGFSLGAPSLADELKIGYGR